MKKKKISIQIDMEKGLPLLQRNALGYLHDGLYTR